MACLLLDKPREVIGLASSKKGDYEYVFYVTNTAYSNDLTPNGFEA